MLHNKSICERGRNGIITKALFLDLGGTLYDSDTPIQVAMQRVYALINQKYGIGELELQKAYALFYPEKDPRAFSEGKNPREYRKSRFRKLLSYFSIEDEVLVCQLELEYTTGFESNLMPYDDVRDALSQLRSRYQIYLVTEGPEIGQRRIVDCLGLTDFFDAIFTSGQAQQAKRDGKLFEYALSQCGLAPKEVVVIGDDHERDVIGAELAGINSVLIDRKGTQNRYRPAQTVLQNLTDLSCVVTSMDFGAKFLRKRNQRVYPPLLILGHPRSGTNYASHTLRDHHAASVSIEPFSMHFGFMVEHECRLWTSADYTESSIHRLLKPSSEATRYFKEFRRWLYAQTGELRVVKETLFFLQMDWLREYLPDVRILYLERDPLGIAASFKQGNFFERWNYTRRFEVLRLEVLQMPALSEYYELFSSPEKTSWANRLALMWLVRVSEARKALPTFEHLAVSYEELATDPHEMFERILRFAGLGVDAAVRNGIDERRGNHKGGQYSTYRDPAKSLNNWRFILTHEEKQAISKLSRRVASLHDITGIRSTRNCTR